MKEYMDRETGEILTESEAITRFNEEHDGNDPTNTITIDDVFAPVVYKYGMRLRGFSIGCQPKRGFLFQAADMSGKYHDIIVYDRTLAEEEVRNYELDFIGPMAVLSWADSNFVEVKK